MQMTDADDGKQKKRVGTGFGVVAQARCMIGILASNIVIPAQKRCGNDVHQVRAIQFCLAFFEKLFGRRTGFSCPTFSFD